MISLKKIFFCTKEELNKNKYIIKFFEDLNDELIIFLNKDNKIKIFSSICPHFGGEITYNSVKDQLACKWHDWKFCSESGKCLTHPIKGRLNSYDFEINPKNLNKYLFSTDKKNIFIMYE